jgi:hypothetical protein
MACPYFMPVERLENGSWPQPARLPLGSGWRGYCTAPGHEREVPPQDTLEAFCNLGYASNCGWAPLDRAWDAVRFAVLSPAEGDKAPVEPSARFIHVCYVCELAHRPVERGDLEFDLQKSIWVRSHTDARLQKMA